jgi:hypothetical protein
MSTALGRKVGSPGPFGSFPAMGKEQYKIKSKLILTKNRIDRVLNTDFVLSFTLYNEQHFE